MYRIIIIADDSATARMVTRRCLEIAGCREATFLEAGTGKEALKLLRERRVDLLVTDLNMPEMDGLTLLKHVKASPKLTDLPVLVISSMSNQSKKNELLDLGAFAVLSKPITPAGVSAALQRSSEILDIQWGEP